MRHTLGVLIIVGALLAGCSSEPGAPTPSPAAESAATPAEESAATPAAESAATPEPNPTAKPKPVKYVTLSKRGWAKLVKAPDKYIGKGYTIWGCITQFDAATGPEMFRADASFKKQKYFALYGDNAFFSGDEAKLADFVSDDLVQMRVVSLGSYSYDTQIGGNTTVPLFQVVTIKRKGSC